MGEMGWDGMVEQKDDETDVSEIMGELPSTMLELSASAMPEIRHA